MSQQTTLPSPANLAATLSSEVQGDVILGLQKKVESFIFFSIQDSAKFRQILKQDIIHKITTTSDVQQAAQKIQQTRAESGKDTLIPLVGRNIAFSALGLGKLGIDVATDFSTSAAFTQGQEQDAIANLADPQDSTTKALTTWKPTFLQKKIDGVLLVTASCDQELCDEVKCLKETLGSSITVVEEVCGKVRPGPEAGHEHFGYLDGVAHPTLIGFNDSSRHPGEAAVDPSVILLGQNSTSGTTPSWTENGSFLVFRELQQLVPEFDDFTAQIAKSISPVADAQAADFIGARIVGRWKSGAPVVLSPTKDDPALGQDVQRNQNFDYSNDLDQNACPYSAHIRKTDPRSGSAPANIPVLPHLIIRAGIPYGPEVTQAEKDAKKTSCERGLAFVCYQSSLESGFQFLQKFWANNPGFPFGNTAKITTPGIDLIIGQSNATGGRTAQGIKPNDANDPANTINTPSNFVVPRGGEYFFSPSLSALKNKLAA
jgi:Dyp-type peroxidase family